ncbi:uncharacterized protein ACA1_155510 [Acanthamoeba castellanii str. Neff]|uniref:Uncharacterized protein n=1 Tax=Acanthamoeba castellanii (strain ATCC 30010 / Neff) TaxID=1257118 RepID=L8GZF2_ACACF|nr:uncharacterized protein ACA1_155510 [Acanthamoeba castellanii str. Neff]ELR18594.1 hypothetical protein ACA1_155510 [Acanthamoeba castellanii str. Neff]
MQKRWTTNAIYPQERDHVFFINTTAGNASLASLLTTNRGGVASRSYVLAHGTPRGGTTTRLLQLRDQLANEGYECAMISLQEGIPFELVAEFWTAMGRFIQRHLGNTADDDVDQIHDAQTFIAFFSREPWASRKVVLIVDQFDLLNNAADLVRDQFLGTLRAMRESEASHGLHAFFGVGPYSILNLQDHPSSPFNACDAFALPMFERNHVRELFNQYSRESNVELAPGIADAIYDLTSGHPGHVCFCGKMIAEHLATGTRKVAYDSWVSYAAEQLLPRLCASWATAGLADHQLSDKPEHIKARHYLTNNFLLQDPTPPDHLPVVAAVTEEDLWMCKFLATEGTVREVSPNQFMLASFLVRNMATWAIIRNRDC